MKLKYITRLSLTCGVMITAVAFSGCSGSPKAVQANAAVMSSSGVMSTEPSSEASDVSSSSTVTSSNLVSSSATQVSSAAMTSGVMSQNSSSLTSVTSKPSTGGSTSRPASTKPASKAPTPTPKPASQALVSRPVSTAPVQTGVSAKYYGATYGATDSSQYKEILSYANGVTGSSTYQSNYSGDEAYKDQFESLCGVAYSEESAKAVAIIGCFQNAGASASHGNAYNAYASGSSNCGDNAKAIQAALHVNGINCKLVWGKNARGQSHMWIMANINGSWLQWGTSRFSSGTPKGYSAYGSGYNY